ncbi:hypothetical protein [Natrialba swarupiae]|uniref:Uncharacterized protein n=1 Tax=Natrialba swarupiae TaxID=2448032 RepID=A0A5D5AQ92_9EURY|nr:hypothetical protein [Natrialba swarupiae]TYT61972.1 hypothetical protein FYC77_10895 [Natrialba swarupiae]
MLAETLEKIAVIESYESNRLLVWANLIATGVVMLASAAVPNPSIVPDALVGYVAVVGILVGFSGFFGFFPLLAVVAIAAVVAGIVHVLTDVDVYRSIVTYVDVPVAAVTAVYFAVLGVTAAAMYWTVHGPESEPYFPIVFVVLGFCFVVCVLMTVVNGLGWNRRPER